MKIKNISNQDISFSITYGNSGFLFNMKPNQVMYCENNNLINKQIVIYEKKKLISVNKNTPKPDYVDYYKCFFEAGDYTTAKMPLQIGLDDDFESFDNDEVSVPEIGEEIPESEIHEMDELVSENTDEESTQSVKRGRGRPKKPVSEKPAKEKKKRGRPKGSTKEK